MPAPQVARPRSSVRSRSLPVDLWPSEDQGLFDAAYRAGDIFDDTAGAGTHLSAATRNNLHYGWARWLGFLAERWTGVCWLQAADRVTARRVRLYVEHLQAEMGPTSVATTIGQLHHCLRLIAPERDWTWLKALKARLQARARPRDRFERLVPADRTLQLGLDLMDDALLLPPSGRKEPEVQYRDGLLLAVLSLWPIRRRSLAALTVHRHLKLTPDRADVQLFPEDTKTKRHESWPVPDELFPYLRRYLDDIRPGLLRSTDNDALWPSLKGGSLGAGQIYAIVIRRTEQAFGRSMGPHDFRRAAATFLAMDAPEKIGLTPGILGHANPEVGARHYNLARSTDASRRHIGAVSAVRARLRCSTTWA